MHRGYLEDDFKTRLVENTYKYTSSNTQFNILNYTRIKCQIYRYTRIFKIIVENKIKIVVEIS